MHAKKIWRFSTKQLMLILMIGSVLWIALYAIIQWRVPDVQSFHYQLWLSRFALVSGIGCIFLWGINKLPSYLTESGSAFNLAVFRLLFFGFFTVGLLIMPSALLDPALQFAQTSVEARAVSPGLEWMAVLPVNTVLVKTAMGFFAIGAVGAFVGFKTRWAIAFFLIGALYLIGIPNLFGKINHNHHIVWFAAVLLFSPCADRLSIDARSAGHKKRSDGVEYQRPLGYIWLLMAVIYFFPGFWKIWSNGLDWVFTENVRNHMYWSWYIRGEWLPWFRLDLYPLLYKGSGLFVVGFELLFGVLILSKNTRLIGVAAGLLFHAGTFLFMDIFFVVLVLSYTSFVNWERLFRRASQRNHEPKTLKANNPLKLMAGILIVVNVIFGVCRLSSFPFTVYPTFDNRVGNTTKTLVYYDGSQQLDKERLVNVFTLARYRDMEYSLIQAHEQQQLEAKMTLLQVLTDQFSAGSVDIYLCEVSVVPETMGELSDSLLLYAPDNKK